MSEFITTVNLIPANMLSGRVLSKVKTDNIYLYLMGSATIDESRDIFTWPSNVSNDIFTEYYMHEYDPDTGKYLREVQVVIPKKIP